jgi:hypothetical protein
MDIWLSILDFYRTWRRELIRYGIAALLWISAMATGKWPLSCLVLGGILAMIAYDKWGEPWRKRGEEFSKRKRR